MRQISKADFALLVWAAALLLVLAVSHVERFEDGSFIWNLAGLAVVHGCLPWGLCA